MVRFMVSVESQWWKTCWTERTSLMPFTPDCIGYQLLCRFVGGPSAKGQKAVPPLRVKLMFWGPSLDVSKTLVMTVEYGLWGILYSLPWSANSGILKLWIIWKEVTSSKFPDPNPGPDQGVCFKSLRRHLTKQYALNKWTWYKCIKLTKYRVKKDLADMYNLVPFK